MKKKVIGLVCLVSLCVMAGCGGSAAGGSTAASKASSAVVSSVASSAVSSAAVSSEEASSAEGGGAMVGVANPWIDCGTLDEAAKITGFSMEAPDKVNGHPRTLVQAVKKNMMQAFYTDKAVGIEGVKKTIIRKGVGKEDISGDYENYEKTEKVKVEDLEVQMKSNKGVVYNITWVKDGYSFAIMSDEGLSKGDATVIVSLVK